jgi:hypothetical protein
MVKKVVLYLLNCVLFNTFFVYRTLNTNKTVWYKNYFLHNVGRSWISEVQKWSESSSDDLQLPGKQTTPRWPKQDPARQDFTLHNLKTLLPVDREESTLQESVKCVLHIRSEVKLDTFVNSVLFHFTKFLVLRNTIQRWTTRHSTCSVCSLKLRSIIYSTKL